MKNKILIICGPTATGKTKLGIQLAKKFNGEIVSADSRQVYKGMDIGTGKDIGRAKWEGRSGPPASASPQAMRAGKWMMDGVPVWMLDVASPDQKFSVALYVELAGQVIGDIWRRGKLPIIVGGTGFYIKGLVDGIETLGVEPDWELREKLKDKKTEELKNILQDVWPQHFLEMNESDKNNSRRLIRAIEIRMVQNPTSPRLRGAGKKSSLTDDVLMIGLTAPKEILYQRIDQRVDERVKMGAEKEVRNILKNGYGWENSVLGTTPGYMEWQTFFENQTSLEEAVTRWKFDEHSCARRQMTWFKKDKRLNWFDITHQNVDKEIEKLVSLWYNRSQDAKKN
ncbi:MAG: tRNA (adenosine(37)-N6)-dimethylallyltransferase MiaA [bacterium]|nr:tRNA (adenosine(37)-N6)-dimethylallyltransferase MiaA [bacterium]